MAPTALFPRRGDSDPTVKVNGTEIDRTPQALTAAVQAVQD
jgi:hypothetical protein